MQMPAYCYDRLSPVDVFPIIDHKLRCHSWLSVSCIVCFLNIFSSSCHTGTNVPCLPACNLFSSFSYRECSQWYCTSIRRLELLYSFPYTEFSHQYKLIKYVLNISSSFCILHSVDISTHITGLGFLSSYLYVMIMLQ